MIAVSSIPDAGSAERPRVLLADDHSAMLALTTDVLAGEFFVGSSLGDGCELLAEAERLHADVIVLDITVHEDAGLRAHLLAGGRHRPRRQGVPGLRPQDNHP